MPRGGETREAERTEGEARMLCYSLRCTQREQPASIRGRAFSHHLHFSPVLFDAVILSVWSFHLIEQSQCQGALCYSSPGIILMCITYFVYLKHVFFLPPSLPFIWTQLHWVLLCGTWDLLVAHRNFSLHCSMWDLVP